MRTSFYCFLLFALIPFFTVSGQPRISGQAELVGFHLGSEYFIITPEIDSDDLRARRVIMVLRCTFSDGIISGIDSKSVRLRIRPEGSSSGITFTSDDIQVFVTEVLSERSALVQFAFPYNLNVLGTNFEVDGSLAFVLEEEEKESDPIEMDLTPGAEISLDHFSIMVSKVEIPSTRPNQVSITFRRTREDIFSNYMVTFYDENMEEIPGHSREKILDNVHEATFTLYQRPRRIFAIFNYVGYTRSEKLNFKVRARNTVVSSGIE